MMYCPMIYVFDNLTYYLRYPEVLDYQGSIVRTYVKNVVQGLLT